MEEAIDKLLSSFAYVRVIGRGGDNHMGLELTVKTIEKPIDDTESRKVIKAFLMQAVEEGS